MFYKYWKKFALTLTALFWAGCDNTSLVDSPDLYGCPPNGCGIPEITSSSSETTLSSKTESSNSKAVSSSGFEDVRSNSIKTDETLVYCYNDTAQNDKGQSFDIISCDDGNKYLRDYSVYNVVPKEAEKLPKDVQIYAPSPGSKKAANCKKGPWRCHDYRITDENGLKRNVGGCNYNTITCPTKNEEMKSVILSGES